MCGSIREYAMCMSHRAGSCHVCITYQLYAHRSCCRWVAGPAQGMSLPRPQSTFHLTCVDTSLPTVVRPMGFAGRESHLRHATKVPPSSSPLQCPHLAKARGRHEPNEMVGTDTIVRPIETHNGTKCEQLSLQLCRTMTPEVHSARLLAIVTPRERIALLKPCFPVVSAPVRLTNVCHDPIALRADEVHQVP